MLFLKWCGNTLNVSLGESLWLGRSHQMWRFKHTTIYPASVSLSPLYCAVTLLYKLRRLGQGGRWSWIDDSITLEEVDAAAAVAAATNVQRGASIWLEHESEV